MLICQEDEGALAPRVIFTDEVDSVSLGRVRDKKLELHTWIGFPHMCSHAFQSGDIRQGFYTTFAYPVTSGAQVVSTVLYVGVYFH